MIVGEIPESVDLLVVGGGPGGYTAAIRGAQAGRRVTLVDRYAWQGLGGTCLQVGCIPSKALIELAGAAQMMAAPTPGLRAAPAVVELADWQAHKTRMIADLAGGVAGLMKGYDVEVIEGQLNFTSADRATVSGPAVSTHLQFKDVIIATGSSPLALPQFPFDHERVLDSSDVLALDHLPATACVIGAGYIGLELGTALAKLGVRVTIVEALPDFLPSFGPATGKAVARSLADLGIELLLNSSVTRYDNAVMLVSVSGEELDLPAEVAVVAVGRTPNTAELGLEYLGVTVDTHGYVSVTEAMLAAPRVAAIGDITRGPALAHRAMAQAAVAVAGLAGEPAAFEPHVIPLVMFTDPEVATCGLSVETAVEAGIEAREVTFPFSALGRAKTIGARHGSATIVIDAEDIVIGATMTGPHASELIAEAAFAIEMSAHLEDLAGTIHAHPTLSESLHEAADLALGHPVHVRVAAAARSRGESS
jgi:dihydrolipoamide dehydrogenase